MHKLPQYNRLLLLTEGQLGVFSSKTAAVLLRYRARDVVGLIDSATAGQKVADFVPWAPAVPILPDVDTARSLGPDAMIIGVAPVGGALPDEMRCHVLAALSLGLDVISGMHTFLGDDPELAALAKRTAASLYDLRRPPNNRVIATGQARQTRARRVLTVGTDCNVGKMVAALELSLAAKRRGVDARFIATGQTGIMIAGRGITIDSCVADFVAGAVEEMVLADGDSDVCFVEGQGSIAHAGYSGVTLSLVHGCCPNAMILVHQLGRTQFKAPPNDPLPSIKQQIAAYEQVAAFMEPARVVGVALNTVGHNDDVARREAARLEAELELPVADPVRDGCERLLDAALVR
jgi:uncharacterized NAD-dependent epimerase/dehydratase family protein